jgi:hypothetical protein
LKFRVIFVLFNIILLLSFGFSFILPALVLDLSSAAHFWASNWFLAATFLAVLAGVDFFFARNWALLSLLENSDWPGLAARLRLDIMERSRYSSARIGLYLNALIILQDHASAAALQERLATTRPRLLEAQSLLFGLSRILSGDVTAAETVLTTRTGSGRGPRGWRAFYLGFTRLRLGKAREAALALLPLLDSREGLMRGLAAYLLALCARGMDDTAARDAAAKAEATRSALARSFPRRRWDDAAENARGDVSGAIASRYIDLAAEWIYAGAPLEP